MIPSSPTLRPLAGLALGAMLASATLAQTVTSAPFGTMPDGTPVQLYTLTNANGLVAKITSYGGIMTELLVPDRDGKLADILLGYDNVDGYIAKTPYFNALIGRYGNRIGDAAFTLDGQTYELPKNDGKNTLHGGVVGYDKVVWEAKPIRGRAALELTLHSPDGDQGFPGNLDIKVVYELSDDNALIISYEAETDAPTIVNLTQHNYYNLKGQGRGNILDHELMIAADHFTPVDSNLIPTGEILTVAGTPMDFTKPKTIGSRVEADFEQLKFGLGYDHNWVLNKNADGEMTLAATLYESDSGRLMEVWTTEPGLQFYGGNFLDGTITGKGGAVYQYRYGLCLETQHFPDSPNHAHFPSTRLNPGETYRTQTIYKFKTQ